MDKQGLWTGQGQVGLTTINRRGRSGDEASLNALIAAVESAGLFVDFETHHADTHLLSKAEVGTGPKLVALPGPIPDDAGMDGPVPLWRRDDIEAMLVTRDNLGAVASWLEASTGRKAWVQHGVVEMSAHYASALSAYPGSFVVRQGDRVQRVQHRFRGQFAAFAVDAPVTDWASRPVKVWCRGAFVGMRLTPDHVERLRIWMASTDAHPFPDPTVAESDKGPGPRTTLSFYAMAASRNTPKRARARVGDWIVRVGRGDFDLIRGSRFGDEFGLVSVRQGSQFDVQRWSYPYLPEWTPYRSPSLG